MRHAALVPTALLLLTPAVAFGQSESTAQAPSKQGVRIDVRIVEADGSAAAQLERSARDSKQLEDLVANGKASLIAQIELQSVYNRPVTAHLGRRVPIQIGTFPTATRAEARAPGEPAAVAFGIPQIQYENSGIRLTATPGAPANGKISIALELTLSDFNASISTLTPVFVTKSINSTITIGEGETVPILNALERGVASDTQSGRAPQVPVRFLVLLTVHSVD